MAGDASPTGQAGSASESGLGQGQDHWKPEELELRREEIRHNRTSARTGTLSTFLQALIAVAAVVAAGAAYFASRDASKAVDVASAGVKVAAEGVERQSSENRLSTAISATGGDQRAERAAGFRLLQHLASREIAGAGSEGEREDAHSLYGAALDVLEVYLRNGPEVPVDSAAEGRGYGYPTVPAENYYAAGVLRELMLMKEQVVALGQSTPRVDLSNVQLWGVNWPGIDFSWLGGHNFPGIDLREADLHDSVWGEINSEGKARGSSLAGAFLQCADLTGSELIGANLTGADLRGADLTGVDGLGLDQLRAARWDERTAVLDSYGPPTADLATAPPNTDGTCMGDYQALPPT